MCAEANLGKKQTGLPLLVVAVGEKMLTWQNYAEHFPVPSAAPAILKGIGHFHPAVQAAAQQVGSLL